MHSDRKHSANLLARNCRLLLLFVFVGMACVAANCDTAGQAPSVRWQPQALSNGSPVLFEIKAPVKARALTGQWMGHSVSFFRSTANKEWYGLAAIPLTTNAGAYELHVTETLAGGGTVDLTRKIRVSSAAYPKITV